jgi:DNA-binding XRE family transcriptional regulator
MAKLFGTKLRFLRHRQELTQEELTLKLGLARQGYLSHLETGRKDPSLELAVKVARFFSVSLDYLLRDTVPLEKQLRERPHSYALSPTERPTDPVPTTFGQKLRHLRSTRQMTQELLARELSLSRQAYISSLEAGRKMPSLSLATQIADYFGVTLDYLLRDEHLAEEQNNC